MRTALGDHLVLASSLCGFRNGRSKTSCVSSRVYLRIQGGEAAAEPTRGAMRCPGNPAPQTWLRAQRLRGWKSQRPRSRGPARPPQGNRLSPKAAQSAGEGAGLESVWGPEPEAQAAWSQQLAPSPAPEHWMTTLRRPEGARTGPGAASPQSGGAVPSLWEDTPEAREARGHADTRTGPADRPVTLRTRPRPLFGLLSGAPRVPGEPWAPEKPLAHREGAPAASPRLVLGGGRGRWLPRPVPPRTSVASQNRSEVRRGLCPR